MKKQNNDLEMAKKSIEKEMKKRYRIKLSSKIGDVFENVALFIIVCLAVVLRPINLIIAGLIIIIILLII